MNTLHDYLEQAILSTGRLKGSILTRSVRNRIKEITGARRLIVRDGMVSVQRPDKAGGRPVFLAWIVD